MRLSVVESLVIQRLDYCNVLYMGLPLKSIWRLQLAQSAVAQSISRTPRMAPVTPLLRKLHWLLVCFWVEFKELVITFKTVHGLGLGYFRDHLTLLE